MSINLLTERTSHERNLMARINRRLLVGYRIRKSPPWALQSLGRYHIRDKRQDQIIDWGISDLTDYLDRMNEVQITL